MRSTFSRANSAASSVKRSMRPSAQRCAGDPLIDPRGLLGLRQQIAAFFAKITSLMTRRAPAHCGRSRPGVRSGGSGL